MTSKQKTTPRSSRSSSSSSTRSHVEAERCPPRRSPHRRHQEESGGVARGGLVFRAEGGTSYLSCPTPYPAPVESTGGSGALVGAPHQPAGHSRVLRGTTRHTAHPRRRSRRRIPLPDSGSPGRAASLPLHGLITTSTVTPLGCLAPMRYPGVACCCAVIGRSPERSARRALPARVLPEAGAGSKRGS